MPIDLTARTAPPAPAARKPRTPAARPAPAVPAVPTRLQEREENLNGLGKITALLLTLRGSYADAGAIAQHGPGVCHETAVLAESDEKIGSLVDYLNSAGPYMGLAAAMLPLAMQFLANHGRLDATRLPPESGVIPPDVLEARVRAEMETQRLRFLKAAQEARQEAEQAQQELAAANGVRS